jgi:phospholipid/cholesterol/gamma-HCH transport system permease protein
MLQRKSYNAAMIKVLINQIYFTTIQLLGLFLIMAGLFGFVIIGAVIATAVNFGLEQSIGSIVVTFVLDVFAVFFTVLLISLRSGAAVATEIAVMNVNKELNFLETYKIDLIDYLVIPRIISGIISVTTLSIIFAVTMMLSGFLFVFSFLNMDFETYVILIFNAMQIENFVLLFVKSIIYGFIIMAIPIYSGLQAKEAYTQIPIAVLNGMVKLFIAIFLVEVISLAVQFS